MDTQNTKISPYDTAYQQKMAQEQKAQATTPIYKKPTLAEKTKGAVQDTKNKIEQKNETARQAYNKPTPEYPTNTMPTETEDELQKAIDGIDFTKKGAEAGATASQSIQNAEMPKYKRATFKDILFDPQFEGKRDSLLANAIGTALGSGIARIGGTDLGVKSALQQYNEAQAQNYAQMQADKDQRALEADIASRETMNAQKVAMEARLADTVADRYIKEYNATEDAKIKKEVLEQMAKDSEVWANLGDKEKLDLAAYMGIVSGNYSLTDLLIQKYAPGMLDMLDALMDKLTNGEWSKLRGKKPANTDNPDSPQTTDPQKKNPDEVTPSDVKTYPTVSSARPVDYNDYKEHPNDYILIPTGKISQDGEEEYIISRRAGDVDATLGNENINGIGWDVYIPSEKEIDELSDVLMNNDRLDDTQRLAYAEKWGGSGVYMGKLKNAVKNKIAYRDEQEKLAQERKKNLYALRDDLSYGRKSPDEVLRGLWKIQASDLDPFDQKVREGVISGAYRQKAMNTYDLVANDEGISNKQKADKYDELLTNYSEYLTPADKQKLERARDDSEAMYKYIEPLNNASNTWFGDKSALNDKGFVTTKNGKAIQKNPKNITYGKYGANEQLDEVESIITKIQEQLQGVSPENYYLYVSKSNIGQYLRNIFNNPSLEKASEKAGEDTYNRYDQLKYAVTNITR